MKYGVELSRRSVPEWKAQNIDYNEIKTLIKKATTSSSSSNNKYFKQLVQLLLHEYESVDMFVKLKSGEIDRRIDDCEKIVDTLAEMDNEVQGITSKAKQNKLLLLHQEINKLSREIQSLSRFVGVQKTGFKKLLKKYKKWSQSNRLDSKFMPILEAPNSFIFENFTSKFLELSLLYEVLREEKFTSIRQIANDDLSHPACLSEFDSGLITSAGRNSIFWVHPDNIVELQVTLLKKLKLYTVDAPFVNSHGSRLALSRKSSTIGVNSTNDGNLDNSPIFRDAESEPLLTYGVFLDGPNFRSAQTAKEPGQIRWADDINNPSMYILCAPVGGLRYFTSMTLSEEQFHRVLERKQLEPEEAVDNKAKLAIGWMNKVNSCPVSQMTSQRTRFIQTSPDNNGVVRAALDTDIQLKSLANDISNKEMVNFPYAVLDIRWTDVNNKPAIVKELEKSHLVQRMLGFSMYAHSFALFHADKLESPPSWMRLLEDGMDIRKAPEPIASKTFDNETLSARRSLKDYESDESSTPKGILLSQNNSHVNLVLDSTDDSSSLISPKTQVNALNYNGSKRRTNNDQDGGKLTFRYWNEFDNPDNEADYGTFFVDEDMDKEGLFSDNNIDAIVDFSSKWMNRLGKITEVFSRKNEETAPLLGSSEDDDDYDDERSQIGSERYSPRLIARNGRPYNDEDMYGEDGMEYLTDKSTNVRDRVVTALYTSCFIFSVLMTAVTFGVVLGEDMDQVTTATFVFTIIAFLFALGVGVLGMCFFMLRPVPGWAHQTGVLAVFFSIVCFTIGGLCWLLS